MGGNFYVYEHWRPDRDECFYVGLGRGRRARVLYGRNQRHTRIQAKLQRQRLSVDIRFVAEGLSQQEACQLERERIQHWRSQGTSLTNLTAGGDGGLNPEPETREKMRARKLGRKLSPEHRAKIGEGSRRALADPELRKKLSVALKAALNRPEVKAKRSASQKARIRTKEHYAKVSATLMGRPLSPEHVAKMRAGLTGRKQSAKSVERRRAANKGRKRSAEFCARMKAAWTPERKAEQSRRLAERRAFTTKNAVIDRHVVSV